MSERTKPVGSACFAIACGVSFLIYAAVSLVYWVDISPQKVLKAWLVLGGMILIGWGEQRRRSSDHRDMRVGQDTIGFVGGLLGLTFAIWALAADDARGRRNVISHATTASAAVPQTPTGTDSNSR